MPKQRDDPAQPGLHPFPLVFQQTFELPLFVCRDVWRGTIVHQCLYTDKHTLQELVPATFNPHWAGKGCFGRMWGSMRRAGDKADNTFSPDSHDWWLVVVKKRRNPWDVVKSLTRNCLWSSLGTQNEESEQELGRRVQLKTNSLCVQPCSSSDLKDNWNGLAWVEEWETDNCLVCGSKSDCWLNEMDSYQICSLGVSVERESSILARFLLELNSDCKLIHHSQTFQSLSPSLLCWIKVFCLSGVQFFF